MNYVAVELDVINRIRERINSIEKQRFLIKDNKKWLQLTSSLNVLEDSYLAVQFYCDSAFPESAGGQYIYLYGLLQALFLQQDAASGISNSLYGKSINWKAEYPDAYNARELRNDVSGHPTNRDGGKSAIYLAQITLRKESFGYMRCYSDESREDEYVCVSVQKAIDNTHNCVNAILRKTSDALETEYQEYVNKFRAVKMKEIFSGLLYAKEKVLTGDLLKPAGYLSSKNMVKKCKDELIVRYGSVNTIDAFAYILKKIDIAFNLIDNELSTIIGPTRGVLEQCLLEYLFDRLDELENLCIEEDQKFEKF